MRNKIGTECYEDGPPSALAVGRPETGMDRFLRTPLGIAFIKYDNTSANANSTDTEEAWAAAITARDEFLAMLAAPVKDDVKDALLTIARIFQDHDGRTIAVRQGDDTFIDDGIFVAADEADPALDAIRTHISSQSAVIAGLRDEIEGLRKEVACLNSVTSSQEVEELLRNTQYLDPVVRGWACEHAIGICKAIMAWRFERLDQARSALSAGEG